MTDYIRVKDENGNEKSIPVDASREGWTVLDKPATNPDGTPMRDKPRTDLSPKSGQKAGTQEKE